MHTQAQDRPLEAHPSAFSDLASDYDAAFSATTLGTYLRGVVWERVDTSFAGRRRILEIGCGTGEDAIHLALRGFEVLATDASPAMLRIAAAKAQAAGCGERIRFRCSPMEALGVELAGDTFDGVLSNFGAINCVSGLDRAVADVATLLEPGAPLVWVVMGRNVPWEWAWFLAHGEWGKAFRRRRTGGTSWRGMQISYPTPIDLERTLRPYFAPAGRRGLGIVLPPTYASEWLERSPRGMSALGGLERVLQRWQPLAALADHYIFEAHRLGASGRA